MRVDPNERDLAIAREAAQKKEDIRQARLARRRAKYRKKKAAEELDSESDDSGQSGSESDDDGQKKGKGKGPGPVKKSKPRREEKEATHEPATAIVQEPDKSPDVQEEDNPDAPTQVPGDKEMSRRDVITSLMGNVSDISSSDSGNRSQVQVGTNKVSVMIRHISLTNSFTTTLFLFN